MIFVIPVRYTFQSFSHRFIGLFFTILRQVSPRCFTRHCCWHRNFQLLRAFFMKRLNYSSSGSMKKIPRNCLALSSFGFSIVHFCFALLFASSDICFHISGHSLAGLEVVCFLVSPPPDHVYPSGGLSFNKMNLVKPVHASDNSLSPSTFQQSSIFSPTIHPVTSLLFW